jgi:hypothetical protein
MFQYEAMNDERESRSPSYVSGEESLFSSSAGQKSLPGRHWSGPQRRSASRACPGFARHADGYDPPFLVTAFATRLSKPSSKAAESPTTNQATRPHRDIGPIGTAARLLVGVHHRTRRV